MKILVLSDLHYFKNDPVSEKKKKFLQGFQGKEELEAVILCGDNAELRPDFGNHIELFGFLRESFKCPIGFILGNHELWGVSLPSDALLHKILPEACSGNRIVYLE